MPIWRHEHRECFTVLPNELIRDSRLSLRDVGLLCYMLSLPPDWDFSVQGMAAVLEHDGVSSIISGLRSLEEKGYLLRKRLRNKSGQVGKAEWNVTDIPGDWGQKEVTVPTTLLEDDLPDVEKPDVEKPNVEKPNVVNRIQTKNRINKEKNKEKTESTPVVFQIPDIQEINRYIQEEGLSIDGERFLDYYTSIGWKIGNTPMRDWKAAARNWSRKEKNNGKTELPYVWKSDYDL